MEEAPSNLVIIPFRVSTIGLYYFDKWHASTMPTQIQPCQRLFTLLDSDTLRQISWEIDIESFTDSQPVCHQLQWDDIDQALETLDLWWNLDLISLGCREFGITLVADDDWAALSSNNLLVCVERLGEDIVTGENHDNRQVLIHKREH